MTKNPVLNPDAIKFRTQDRFSRSHSISETELEALELTIAAAVQEFNGLVAANNPEQIAQGIANLCQLINKEGVTFSNSIFQNPQFIANLDTLLKNPNLLIPTCKLISGILYFTTDFGLLIANLLEPVFQLFISNVHSPNIQAIVNLLCNLSSHLQLHLKVNEHTSERKVHPLRALARQIQMIMESTQNDFQITLSYLLFIRHIANFAMPTDESYPIFVHSLMSLLMNPQVTANNQFIMIVLWTFHDSVSRFLINNEYPQLIEPEFLVFLVGLMKSNGFIYSEPILNFLTDFLKVIYLRQNLENIELQPELDFDIPTIFQICLEGPDDSIKYAAFAFVDILTKAYPTYMAEQNLLPFIQAATQNDLSYQAEIQLHSIACSLLSRLNLGFLNADAIKQLLQLITGNAASGDERIERLTVSTIIRFKLIMEKSGRSEEFCNLLSETGAADFLEQIQSTTQDETILEQINLLNADPIGEDYQQMNLQADAKIEEFQAFDNGQILSDSDIELLETYLEPKNDE